MNKLFLPYICKKMTKNDRKNRRSSNFNVLVGLVSNGKERVDMMFTGSDPHAVRC